MHALLVSTAGIRMHFFAHDAAEPSMAWASSEAQFYVAFSAAVFSARVLKGMATLTQAKVDAAWTQDGECVRTRARGCVLAAASRARMRH